MEPQGAGDGNRNYMSEDNLARRLESLRTERGWSQERLAREMARVGVPIPQSAISKIERTDGLARRTISVDEALGFADVFEMPLPDLLHSPEDVAAVQMTRDLRDGPLLQAQWEKSTRARDEALSRIADRMGESQMWHDRVTGELEMARRRLELDEDGSPENREAAGWWVRFFTEALERFEARSRRAPAEREQQP